MIKTIWVTLLMVFTAIPTFSQEVAMADNLRSEGKIYVVVAILSIIIIGLFGYLFFLDKKLTKKENTINNS